MPRGFRLIYVHTIFDVTVDGRHKSRVVVDGHLTATPLESIYSGVVLLQGLRTCVLIGELDGMVPWAIDYLVKLWLVYARSTTRLQLAGFANGNLHQKLLLTMLNSYLEKKCAEKLLTIDRTFDTWASQCMTWTMYGETTRVWSIAQLSLKPSSTIPQYLIIPLCQRYSFQNIYQHIVHWNKIQLCRHFD